jgi:hypothetical protein
MNQQRTKAFVVFAKSVLFVVLTFLLSWPVAFWGLRRAGRLAQQMGDV